jgi:branched-subunit amino acid aminotransferase/4-amino-4-deoxychorismate lyase
VQQNLMPAFRNSQALHWNSALQDWELSALDECRWSLHDAGALYGAMVVERFRTLGGSFFDLQDRWERFSLGLQVLDVGFELSQPNFEEAFLRLLELNRDLIAVAGDVSLVAVASPGEVRGDESSPTVVLHISPLSWTRLASWYRFGTPLFLSSYSAVPDTCWPTQLKTRSRLPYYLSELELAKKQRKSQERMPIEALPLLKTIHGSIADTALANIVIVDKHGVVRAPAIDSALEGCSLKLATRLLRQIEIELIRSDVTLLDLHEAREVWLTGSSGCIWRASSLDGRELGTDKAFTLFGQLKAEWIRHVGHDFERQAIQQIA